MNTQNQQYIDDQYLISINKFIVLCIVTLGLYQVWWIYKQWVFFKQKEQSDIFPALRALFNIFFLYALLQKVLDTAQNKGYTGTYSSISLYIGFIFVNLIGGLDEKLWLMALFSSAFLIPAFKAVTLIKENSTEFNVIEQHQYNSRQLFLLLFGSVLWVFIFMSYYRPAL